MVATSEVSVSLSVDNEDNLDKIVDELKAIANVFLNVGACLLAGWFAIELMKG